MSRYRMKKPCHLVMTPSLQCHIPTYVAVPWLAYKIASHPSSILKGLDCWNQTFSASFYLILDVLDNTLRKRVNCEHILRFKYKTNIPKTRTRMVHCYLYLLRPYLALLTAVDSYTCSTSDCPLSAKSCSVEVQTDAWCTMKLAWCSSDLFTQYQSTSVSWEMSLHSVLSTRIDMLMRWWKKYIESSFSEGKCNQVIQLTRAGGVGNVWKETKLGVASQLIPCVAPPAERIIFRALSVASSEFV